MKQVKYLSFDVSVENLPVMDVFEAQTDLNKPGDDLRNTQLCFITVAFSYGQRANYHLMKNINENLHN